MSHSPHRPGTSASQSFRVAEVELLDELFRILRRGGDVSILARNPAASSVARKVQAMQRSIARQRERRGTP